MEQTVQSAATLAPLPLARPAVADSACAEPSHIHGNCSHETLATVPTDAQPVTDTPSDGTPLPPIDELKLIEALKEVIDPELFVNVIDLGLIYEISHEAGKVQVLMTLTSPACPAGPQLVNQSKMAVEQVPGVRSAEIKLTLSPPWTPARMTDAARDLLGIF